MGQSFISAGCHSGMSSTLSSAWACFQE